MNTALFAKAVSILILVLCKPGSSEEQTQSDHDDTASSREKRGLNMLRLGRGLQMLRLGKRSGLNMLRLGRSSPSDDDISNYLYNLIESVNPETFESEEDYLYPESRYRRSVDRAVALPRIGKDLEDEQMYEKRRMAMLRLGRADPVEGGDFEINEDVESKRALGMLRLGKRPMSMLRLGKRPMSMLRLGKRPMSMLRLGKRPMSMLRLGKRPMSMLRLGKRPMSMLRLGKRPMSMLRLGKRPMSMLRLGKRADEEDSDVV